MPPSGRRAYVVFSAIYLVALTCVAVYALYTIQEHRLPIPAALAAFTLALPAIAGVVLEALTGDANKGNSRSTVLWSPKVGSKGLLSHYGVILLFVYEAVLATLAGTHISPVSGLRCGLDERWLAMFKEKNAIIGKIQDAFQCCGLHSLVDKAYPFPNKERGADACVKMYNRQRSCFDSWQSEERLMAGLLLLVTIAVAVWKVIVIYMQTRGVSWSEEAQALNREEDGAERRALEYTSAETPYRDQPEIEDGVEQEQL
ncbi:uncharacterized protein PV09_02736 [Verruconis gallopava]|uniref:Tetraspanin Tsp3 n=1 Tax=Verruconis gallopava TaxID=253628 RepID=A0A0D2B4U9_9PEZI|nr:uncharacterized protein PV09_02736 [Verruconis gallopava]KIW06264.1 hypothetical protein PV09_02736 [Verruconis gallopava]